MSLRHWTRFCTDTLSLTGERGKRFFDPWWTNELAPRLTAQERPYHNLTHLEDLFSKAEKFQAKDKTSIGLAIYFHDVIYEPRVGRNEERSAEVFKKFATEAREFCSEAWCDEEHTEVIAQWILETAHHIQSEYVSPFSHDDFLLFLDIDMSILGSEPERYQRYAADVRIEYNHVNECSYINGRSRFLEQLLDVPGERLFRTPECRAIFLANAYSNARAEINSLAQRKLKLEEGP